MLPEMPPEIWNKILYHAFIGQEGPDTDTLDNCRQVCRDWNEMIKRFVWQRPNKEWGIITKSMIEKNWSLVPGCLPSDKMIFHAKELEMEGVMASGVLVSLAERVKDTIDYYPSSLPVITCAASLAHHGYLGSVERMVLCDVDLTSVPAEHLASLVSSVTGSVTIDNVSWSGLDTILDNDVKSEQLRILGIYRQSFGSEETRALVRAMESRVEWVRLGVTLDIGALLEYSGQGKCGELDCHGDTLTRYRDQLRTWARATSRNWKVLSDCDDYLGIRRI